MEETNYDSTPNPVTWPLKVEKVLLAGDWHGQTWFANKVVAKAKRLGADLILQLGDFGVWPGTSGGRYLKGLNYTSKAAGIPIAFIDGNHEEFPQIYSYPVGDDGLRRLRENIWHIPRISSWNWGGLDWFALGGATSLDRPHRVLGKSYWEEEEITPSQIYQVLNSDIRADVALFHDCPTAIQIPGIHHRVFSRDIGFTYEELERAWNHRDKLEAVCESLKPRVIAHGHFHIPYMKQNVSAWGRDDVTAIGLSDQESLLYNTMLVDVSDGFTLVED